VRERRAAAAAGAIRVQVTLNQVGVARVGFVVPRSVGGAVVRNRVRRRLRALLAPRLSRHSGIDVVVAATEAAATRPFGALAVDLDASLAGALRRLPAGDGVATGQRGGDRGSAPGRPLWDNRGSGGSRPGRVLPAGSPAPSP
jgi:ribonuclease P protein component